MANLGIAGSMLANHQTSDPNAVYGTITGWNPATQQLTLLDGAIVVDVSRAHIVDKQTGLLGRGILRFDLRIPGKMIARLPRAPGEPIEPAAAAVTPPPAPAPAPAEPEAEPAAPGEEG